MNVEAFISKWVHSGGSERANFHQFAFELTRLLEVPPPKPATADAPNDDCRFDSPAAKVYAEIAAQRRAAGRPIAEADCQIAAIARATDAPIATRNVKDFDGCGIRLINPWNDQ